MAGNERTPDFSGWATKNDLECGDGRVICKNAFAVQDGAKVPLVWNHEHNDPGSVLGHAILRNRDEGVWAECFFNDGKKADEAREAVKHGDVNSLSIWANKLKQDGRRVLHGMIREVSLVLAGANPGAIIESVVAHGYPLLDDEDEGIVYTGDFLELYHADEKKPEQKKEEPAPKEETAPEEDDSEEDGDETVQDVLDTLTPKQKRVVNAIIGMALESAAGGSDDDSTDTENSDEEEEKMAHNVFESNNEEMQEGAELCLSHSDVREIMGGMKAFGSLRESWNRFVSNRDEKILMHGGVPVVYDESDALVHGIPEVPTTGMTLPAGSETYGFKSPDMFYPDAKALATPPEFIGRGQEWVNEVLNNVHRTPFSRIKSWFADITEDEARARGYIKGKQKKTEVFQTLKRTTTPTTIYKMQKLDRDDIIDITDFDIVSWIRGEMNMMLREEQARAILLGDGRDGGSDDKINESCIRPIVSDVDLFNVKVKLQYTAGTSAADKARAVIDGVIRAHKSYKGSGNPVFFTTEDWLTEMLLLEDKIGHKLYKTVQELATALRVSKIVTVELMEGQKVGEGKDEDLVGVIVNMRDYNVGMDRGGQTSMFDDFDIDYNRQKYLIETRMSGALIKPFSAMTISIKQSGE